MATLIPIFTRDSQEGKALTITRLTESVSWTRAPYPTHQKKPKAEVSVKTVGETAAGVAALPLKSRLGIAETPHSGTPVSGRECPVPGCADGSSRPYPLTPSPGGGSPAGSQSFPRTWRLLCGLGSGAHSSGKGVPPVTLSGDIGEP